MMGDGAFFVRHWPLAASLGLLLVYAVVACGVGLYMGLQREAGQSMPRWLAMATAAVLLALGMGFAVKGSRVATAIGGGQILAGLLMLTQYARRPSVWQMRLGGLGLVVMGGYWVIVVALTTAPMFSVFRSWFEGLGGILVLLGITMLWSGAGGWFAPLEEVGEKPSPPRRLRKFRGEISR